MTAVCRINNISKDRNAGKSSDTTEHTSLGIPIRVVLISCGERPHADRPLCGSVHISCITLFHNVNVTQVRLHKVIVTQLPSRDA